MRIPLCWLVAALVMAAAPLAHAEVRANISSSTGQVGSPLQLTYTFLNTGEPRDMPRSIMADGLDIRLTGQSRRVEMINFQTTSSIIYSYTVVPNRPGQFTIPGFAVSANGQQVRTPPVEVRVTGPGGVMPPAPPPPSQQVLPAPQRPGQQRPPSGTPGRSAPRTADGEPAPYFAEMIMGSSSAFVGEVIPVVLRFYFRGDIAFDNLQRPMFGGDGFTAAPLSEPQQTDQFIDNVPYNIVSFDTAITPVKTGTIEIPAAVMEGRMMTQGAMPMMDPFFDQFFRNFPMPGIGRAENIEARTATRKLEVQALPRDGRPDSFNGAIGQFTLDSSATPKRADAGEPVTLSLTVKGRGNFDAITAPVLTGEDGWRVYAPKDTFTANDAIGYGGTKTFEISMVARLDQTATPGAEFSYFDPQKKKYVTLTAKPVAVTAAGRAATDDDAPAPRTAAAAGDEEVPARPVDIAAPAPAPAGDRAGFVPWLLQPWFHALQWIALVAVVLSVPYLLWLRRRARKSALTASTEAAVREAKAVWTKTTDPAEFYSGAAQFVLARLALLDGCAVGLVNPDEALPRRVSDPVRLRELQTLLARRDEVKYSGSGAASLDPSERQRWMALLDQFAHG